jgi:multidrug transporter EmrE-like cation transporter
VLAGAVAAFAARPGIAGTMLAVSTGLIWGGSDVTIKALSAHTDSGLGVLVHPLAPVIAILSFVGLVISARSLQVGKAVPVIAITSATANVVTIASGLIVFGEPLPDEPLALAVRMLAFVLVIGAAALTPPPGAAEEATSAPATARPVRETA